MAVTHSPDRAPRLAGAIVGIFVFLAGIALIGYVFSTARAMFDAPPQVIPASAFATPAPVTVTTPTPTTTTGTTPSAATATTATTATPAAPSAVAIISQDLSTFVKRLLILLLMCIVGSVVASKGIDMFFKAIAAPRDVSVSNGTTTP